MSETNQQTATRKAVAVEAATRQRARQDLELKREHILAARTSSPHRRAALEAALSDIEAELARL